MVGNTVTVITSETTYDENKDRVIVPKEEVVENVLIAPGNTSDINAAEHFSGVKIDFTLGFPKTFEYKSLREAQVKLPAPWNVTGRVIGDPIPNDPKNCPTEWYLTVYLEVHNG